MKRTWKQIGSMLLAVCMVFTMLPVMTFAESGAKDSGTPLGISDEITAFADLDTKVSQRMVEIGTQENELNLPGTLAVTVTTGSAVTANVSGDDTATGSDAQGPETTEPEETETTIAVSGWTCKPAYDGGTAGDYVFTPTLALPEGWTLAEDVSAPTITVTVREESAEPQARGMVGPLGVGIITGTMNIGGETVTNLTQNANGTGWTWDAESATLTLNSSYQGGYIKFECADTNTINLVCEGDVTVNQGFAYAIECSGRLVIKGDSQLTLSGGLRASKDIVILGTMGDISGGSSGGIDAGGSITIYGVVGAITSTVNAIYASGDVTIYEDASVGKIVAGGTDPSSSSYGIYSQNGGVTINGVTGDISGQHYGIYANGGNVFINGTTGAISSTDGSSSGDSAIRASSGVAINGETGVISSKGDYGIYAESDKVLITGKTGDIIGTKVNGIKAANGVTISPNAVVGNIVGAQNSISAVGGVTIGGKTGNITGVAGSIFGGIRATGSVTITGETGDITSTHPGTPAIEAGGDVLIIGSVGEIAVTASSGGEGFGIQAGGDIHIINSVTISGFNGAFNKAPTTLPSSYTATWSDNVGGSSAASGSTYTWSNTHKYVKITVPTTVPTTTETDLITALESTTPSIITLGDDITLSTQTVNMGASHTIDTGSSTLTISGGETYSTGGRIDLGTHTLTLKGTVVIDSVQGIRSASGTLNLENVTATLKIANSIYAGTVNVNNGATVHLDSSRSGVLGTALLTLPGSTASLNINFGGVVNIRNADGRGINNSNGGTININSGGTVSVGEIRSKNGGIAQEGSGVLKLNVGGALDGTTGGAVFLNGGTKVDGMNGKLIDQGTTLTATGEVIVGAENATPSASGLSAGLYVWNGSAFAKAGGDPIIRSVTITDIVEPVGGASPVKTGATVPADANYALREGLVWVDDENKTEPMADGAKFEAGKRYLCAVSVKLPSGHSFAHDVTATINGKTATVMLDGTKEAVVSYLFTAKDADDTPTITVTKHPQNVTVTQGRISGKLTTEATASNSKPVSYQWSRMIGGDGGDNTEIIIGATSNTFTIPTNLTAGKYDFICTYSAEGCDSIDHGATVTVKEPSGGGDGGGDGGGGGSSSGGSPTTPITTTPGIKPNQPVTASAPVTATAGTGGAANAAITDKTITDAIARAQSDAQAQGKTANGISVALDITMPKGATSLTTTLTQNSLNSLVSAGVTNLELNGAPVYFGLDLTALKEIQKQSGGDITISITPATGLSKEAKALFGNRPVYNITISTVKDGKTINVTSLGNGMATLSIPYTPGKNEAVGYLFGVYVDAKGKAARIDGSTYDANARAILISASHFSVYGVGYTAPSAKFTDISTHWGKEAIDYVVGRGLLSGTSETTFAPDTAMTRGMLVTALGRLLGVDVKAYTTSSFTDVKADSTFRPYIEWAYSKGVVQGIGNQQFAPDRAITREEIAVIFANYAKATGYKLPVTREATTYADASSIGSVYKTAVTAMQQAGIMMGGTNNKFNPKANATRAEVSSMLHRYIKLTIDPATAQGWALNDVGQYLYYKDGKALTGMQTIDGVKYFFNADGTLKTGWAKDDAGNWRFYLGKTIMVGFRDLGANGNQKTHYFSKDGVMVSGKWLQIDGKWYYFYSDGTLAKSIKIDEYEVDENGVRKTK